LLANQAKPQQIRSPGTAMKMFQLAKQVSLPRATKMMAMLWQTANLSEEREKSALLRSVDWAK
jgi:hypothetical protein